MDINDIKPYERNAKQHPDSQVNRIANSILRFGFKQAVVLNRENEVIVGHGRYLAVKKLGWTEAKEAPQAKKGEKFLPYTYADDLSEEEVKAYRLADNKLNESDWDMGLAIEELKLLPEDLQEITGFNTDLVIDPDEKDDEVPEGSSGVASRGKMWQLGRHRLLCGDATNIEDVKKLMGEQKADMVFTDPPYNVNYSGSGKETSEGIMNDDMSPAEFQIFLDKTFANYREVVKISAPFYICHSSSSQRQFEDAMEKAELKVKNQIIWNKTLASMGWGDYRWKHEPIFYATFEGKNTQFYGDRTNVTVWNESWDIKKIERNLKQIATAQEKGGSTVWTIGREQDYKHPTQKPVELIRMALENSSKAEDLVLDLFGGSGSTLIACEKLNRSCYLMELDPKYADKIIARFEQYTGGEAKLIA